VEQVEVKENLLKLNIFNWLIGNMNFKLTTSQHDNIILSKVVMKHNLKTLQNGYSTFHLEKIIHNI